MSFWDDISKGAKDAANFTVKKTEELTSIAKLKISLRGEESKLDDCFENIGELYYLSQRSGTDNTDAIAQIMKDADEIKAKITTLKKELSGIQGDEVCRMCGTVFNSEYRFCPKCGAEKSVPKAAEPEKEQTENTEE